MKENKDIAVPYQKHVIFLYANGAAEIDFGLKRLAPGKLSKFSEDGKDKEKDF